MTTYRKIAALRMPDVTPGGADMPEPRFERARPADLMVDETYQRNLSERSVRLIRKIVANWDWRTFMPPVVVKTKAGMLVIDGQHTAIAAATHPLVNEIPIMVVKADASSDQAKAFLGRNRDRITVTPNQLHAAAVIAGDEDALTVHQVCQRAGVTILKQPPGAAAFKVGETLAVGTIGRLVDRRGAMRARQVLEVITKAKIGPVPATIIKATEAIMCDPELKIDPDDITTVIRSGVSEIEIEGKILAASIDVPLWKAITEVMLKRCRRGSRRAA